MKKMLHIRTHVGLKVTYSYNKEQDKNNFKPKWNMFLTFWNNILSYRNKFIKESNIQK